MCASRMCEREYILGLRVGGCGKIAIFLRKFAIG